MKFEPMEKIARLSREVIVTEKIDGTNASVYIEPVPTETQLLVDMPWVAHFDGFRIAAGSRTRWLDISSKGDNFGFAKWVEANAEELALLGPGQHFGEWWGQGIQRGYGQDRKRFSLFNVHRWGESRPACCDVVPVLWTGNFDTDAINNVVNQLRGRGSSAAPGFMNPEGVVVYHTAAKTLFKKTLEKDDQPKGV